MDDSLIAHFVRRFPGGASIRGALERPARGRSVTVLFGPSGCGKTTVLRCLAGLDRPAEGTIRFGAETWFSAADGICRTPQQRAIGFVFQDYALFPHLTVAGNVGYGLRGLPRGERARRVDELLARFGLGDLASRRPDAISGGQLQRVALARALARRPRLLLLDEPLSALDTALREEMRAELQDLLAGLDIPCVLVTHDRAEARSLADWLVVMDGGQVQQCGPTAAVFAQPANRSVARSLGVPPPPAW